MARLNRIQLLNLLYDLWDLSLLYPLEFSDRRCKKFLELNTLIAKLEKSKSPLYNIESQDRVFLAYFRTQLKKALEPIGEQEPVENNPLILKHLNIAATGKPELLQFHHFSTIMKLFNSSFGDVKEHSMSTRPSVPATYLRFKTLEFLITTVEPTQILLSIFKRVEETMLELRLIAASSITHHIFASNEYFSALPVLDAAQIPTSSALAKAAMHDASSVSLPSQGSSPESAPVAAPLALSIPTIDKSAAVTPPKKPRRKPKARKEESEPVACGAGEPIKPSPAKASPAKTVEASGFPEPKLQLIDGEDTLLVSKINFPRDGKGRPYINFKRGLKYDGDKTYTINELEFILRVDRKHFFNGLLVILSPTEEASIGMASLELFNQDEIGFVQNIGEKEGDYELVPIIYLLAMYHQVLFDEMIACGSDGVNSIRPRIFAYSLASIVDIALRRIHKDRCTGDERQYYFYLIDQLLKYDFSILSYHLVDKMLDSMLDSFEYYGSSINASPRIEVSKLISLIDALRANSKGQYNQRLDNLKFVQTRKKVKAESAEPLPLTGCMDLLPASRAVYSAFYSYRIICPQKNPKQHGSILRALDDKRVDFNEAQLYKILKSTNLEEIFNSLIVVPRDKRISACISCGLFEQVEREYDASGESQLLPMLHFFIAHRPEFLSSLFRTREVSRMLQPSIFASTIISYISFSIDSEVMNKDFPIRNLYILLDMCIDYKTCLLMPRNVLALVECCEYYQDKILENDELKKRFNFLMCNIQRDVTPINPLYKRIEDLSFVTFDAKVTGDEDDRLSEGTADTVPYDVEDSPQEAQSGWADRELLRRTFIGWAAKIKADREVSKVAPRTASV